MRARKSITGKAARQSVGRYRRKVTPSVIAVGVAPST